MQCTLYREKCGVRAHCTRMNSVVLYCVVGMGWHGKYGALLCVETSRNREASDCHGWLAGG